MVRSPPIELRHLRYLMAAIEHGSFRKAALALRVSESAVSRRIRDLEDTIGVTLFLRHNSGVRPTAAGEQFVAHARRAVAEIEFATREAIPMGTGETGVVRIAICSSLSHGFLADLLRAYQLRHPQVRLEFVHGSAVDLLPVIRRQDVDISFAITAPEADDCEVMPLWKERAFVAMSSSHILVNRCEIAWDDLRKCRFIASREAPGPEYAHILNTRLAQLGDSLAIEWQAVHRDTMMQLVANGDKLKFTTEATTATHYPGVVFRPVVDGDVTFSGIWSRTNGNPAFRRLLAMARTLSTEAAASTTALKITLVHCCDAPSQILDPLP